jgi:hypothetical protein
LESNYRPGFQRMTERQIRFRDFSLLLPIISETARF